MSIEVSCTTTGRLYTGYHKYKSSLARKTDFETTECGAIAFLVRMDTEVDFNPISNRVITLTFQLWDATFGPLGYNAPPAAETLEGSWSKETES